MPAPDHDRLVALLRDAYAAVGSSVADLDEEGLDVQTGAEAWRVRDLLLHLLGDARRALVALASTTADEPDVDEATYWQGFRPDLGDGGSAGAAVVRRIASAHGSGRGIVEEWSTTSAAVVRAAGAADPGDRVATQGHVLAVPDLVSTLVLEATVHLLDLRVAVPGPDPAPGALGLVRRVLEGLHGGPLPEEWSDLECAQRGTGRAPVPEEWASRLPLLG